MTTDTDKQIDRLLAERPYRQRQFDDRLRRRVVDVVRDGTPRRGSRLRMFALAAAFVVLVGGGALLWSRFDGTTVPDKGAAATGQPSAEPEQTASGESPDYLTLASTKDGRFRLEVDRRSEAGGGYPYVYVVEDGGERRRYDWRLDDYAPRYAPTLQLTDLTGDGREELVATVSHPKPGGGIVHEARVVDTATGAEIPVESPSEYAAEQVRSQVTMFERYAWIKLDANGQVYEKAIDAALLDRRDDVVRFDHAVDIGVVDRPLRLFAHVDAVVGEGDERVKIGTVDVSYRYSEQGAIVVDRIGFQPEPEAAGDIPLFAIEAPGGGYVALRGWDDEMNPEALFGKPLQESTEQLDGYAGTFAGMYTKTQKYDGLELYWISGDGERFWLTGMRVASDRFASSLGIRVGDTAEAVERAYPSVTVALDGREPPGPFAYVLGEGLSHTSLLFEIEGGVVKEMYFEYLMD